MTNEHYEATIDTKVVEVDTGWTQERLVAFIRLAAMLITSGLMAFKIAVDVDMVYAILSFDATVAAIFWGWWKNNNVTSAAQLFEALLKGFKKEHKEEMKLEVASLAEAKEAKGDEE